MPGKSDCINNEEPSEFLVCNSGLIPLGKVLDLAMGGGRNAVYLAKQGFDVEGVDVSDEAVMAAEKLAALNRVKIRARVADLELGYKIAAGTYGCIICFNFLQRSLIDDIKNGLKSGGLVMSETYIVDQAILGRPKNPDHLLNHNELLATFHDFRCLRYREGIFGKDKKLRAIASIAAVKA